MVFHCLYSINHLVFLSFYGSSNELDNSLVLPRSMSIGVKQQDVEASCLVSVIESIVEAVLYPTPPCWIQVCFASTHARGQR